MQLLSNEHLPRLRQTGQELLRASASAEPGENPVAVLSTFNADLLAPFLAERLSSFGMAGSVFNGP